MKLIKHLVLSLLVLIMLFPVIFVFVGSTNDSGWAFEIPFKLTFGISFFDNYLSVTNDTFNVWQALLISFSSSLLVSLISVFILFFASYALSKFDFKCKNIIWIIVLSMSLIPQPSYLIGQLDVINNFQLYSTFSGLVLPFIINLRVFIYLKEACTYIPNSILDAGRIEGAGEFRVMMKIAIPNVKDKIAMSAFLLFVASWNNFLVPMIITSESDLFNLPTLISSLADPLRYDLGAVFMALLFSIIPVMLIFLLSSHWIFNKENKL